jgi:hypothetical protein
MRCVLLWLEGEEGSRRGKCRICFYRQSHQLSRQKKHQAAILVSFLVNLLPAAAPNFQNMTEMWVDLIELGAAAHTLLALWGFSNTPSAC